MEGRVHKDLNITHLDPGIIKRLPIEKMKHLSTVTFCGNFGDPLMHPALDEIIDFFQNQQIVISTNASLRSKDWWGQLGKNKNIGVTFCIDGIGSTHELYRRNTSYEKIIENAKSFIQSGGTARWQFIVFRHNEHQLEKARKLSEEMGFKEFKFMYSDRFDTDNTWKVYDEGRYLYDLEKASHQNTLRESLDVPVGEKYWKALYKGRGEVSCLWSQNNSLYIHSDGCVYPCCMLASVQAGKDIEKLMLKKIVKDFTDMDLHHNDLSEILASEIFRKNLPNSLRGDPLQHPICIEWCNKNTGKSYFENKVK